MKVILILVALVGLSAASSKRADLSCNCGWTNSGRIVGGTEVTPNKYPWMAALYVYDEQQCGASIITPWHALTAAHCGEIAPAYNMKLIIGAHNLNGRTVSVPVSRIINHEGWGTNHRSSNFDISLLVTGKQIPFSKTVGPICMPSKPLSLDNQFIKVTGWGNTLDSGKASHVLLEVDLKVMPQNQCSKYWNGLQQKLCAIGVKKDSCQGDSGGPLVWLDPASNRYTQAALVSYGAECGGPKPSVNTDVSTYIDWINKKIQLTKPGVQVCSRRR